MTPEEIKSLETPVAVTSAPPVAPTLPAREGLYDPSQPQVDVGQALSYGLNVFGSFISSTFDGIKTALQGAPQAISEDIKASMQNHAQAALGTVAGFIPGVTLITGAIEIVKGGGQLKQAQSLANDDPAKAQLMANGQADLASGLTTLALGPLGGVVSKVPGVGPIISGFAKSWVGKIVAGGSGRDIMSDGFKGNKDALLMAAPNQQDIGAITAALEDPSNASDLAKFGNSIAGLTDQLFKGWYTKDVSETLT
jgi:hypothetical protein